MHNVKKYVLSEIKMLNNVNILEVEERGCKNVLGFLQLQ